MKLLYIISAILALTLAEEEKQLNRKTRRIEDSVASARSSSRYATSKQAQLEKWESQQLTRADNNYVQPQNDYYWVNPTPVPDVKNDIYWGPNGDYQYEYKTPDGTHVFEQGWYTDPLRTDSSLVKKGWYSHLGADGRRYTVNYWADHTGYHAYGDHLPSTNQPSKPVQTTTQRPIYTTTPYPIHYPSYPTNQQQTYPTNQQQTYPTNQQQTYPTNQQQTYPTDQQQTYPTNQQQTYPNYQNQQQTYYPQQQVYYANNNL